MIDQFWTWFNTQAETQIFGGIAAVSILGYLGFLLRAVPAKLLNWCKRSFTTQVTVRSDDQMFFIVAEWLGAQHFMSRSRRLKLVTKSAHHRNAPQAVSDEEQRLEYLFVPAPGMHWFWHRGRPILLEIGQGQDGKSETKGFIIIENITLHTLGRTPSIFRDIMDEAIEQITTERRIRVTIHGEYGWSSSRAKLPRPLASVITKNGTGERLLADMETFFASRGWYVQRGIPWRRGYMLVGPPGTGKSSLVFALASEMSVPIFALSLGTAITDGGLSDLLMTIPERSVLLIEDIDTFTVAQSRKLEKDGEKKEFVSLSALLNALDGVIAGEGRVVIMTTNHPEKLDRALTRAGRIDRSETLSLFGPDECARMWRLFFGADHPNERTFLDHVGDEVQPAALQEHLMLYRNDPLNAAVQASHVWHAHAEPLREIA